MTALPPFRRGAPIGTADKAGVVRLTREFEAYFERITRAAEAGGGASSSATSASGLAVYIAAPADTTSPLAAAYRSHDTDPARAAYGAAAGTTTLARY